MDQEISLEEPKKAIEIDVASAVEYCLVTRDQNEVHSRAVMGDNVVVPGLQMFSSIVGDAPLDDYNSFEIHFGNMVLPNFVSGLEGWIGSSEGELFPHVRINGGLKGEVLEREERDESTSRTRIYSGTSPLPEAFHKQVILKRNIDLEERLGMILGVKNPGWHYALGTSSAAISYAISGTPPVEYGLIKDLLKRHNAVGKEALGLANALRKGEPEEDSGAIPVYSSLNVYWPGGIRSLEEDTLQFGLTVNQRSKSEFEICLVCEDARTTPLYVARSVIKFMPKKVFLRGIDSQKKAYLSGN